MLSTCFRHAHASRKPGLQPGLQLAGIMECGHMGDRSPVTRQIRDKNKDNKLYKLHKKLIYRRQNTVTVGDPARPLYEIWFQNLEPLCYLTMEITRRVQLSRQNTEIPQCDRQMYGQTDSFTRSFKTFLSEIIVHLVQQRFYDNAPLQIDKLLTYFLCCSQ